MDLTIVIPTFNEEASLPSFIDNITSFIDQNPCRVIFVNDGSSDRTPELLKALKDHPHFQIIHHKQNRGYGGAIKSGIAAATTPYTITIDADGQHQFEDVLKLFESIQVNDADMVVGNRVNRGSSRLKSLGKWIIRTLAKMMLPVNIKDLNSGMKIFRTDLARKYAPLYPTSMAFSNIIPLVFIHFHHLVLEENISIKPRREGTSTITTQTAFQTVIEIINIVTLFSPMKIFLPISALLLFVGLAWGFKFMLMGRGLSIASSFLLSSSLITFLLGLVAEQLSHIRKDKFH